VIFVADFYNDIWQIWHLSSELCSTCLWKDDCQYLFIFQSYSNNVPLKQHDHLIVCCVLCRQQSHNQMLQGSLTTHTLCFYDPPALCLLPGGTAERLYESAYHRNLVRLPNHITSDPSPVPNSDMNCFHQIRDIPGCNEVRLKHCFVPQSLLILNSWIPGPMHVRGY